MELDAYAIQDMGKLCIHGEPPVCVTACPVHLDVWGMLKFIQQGKFDEALQIYQKQIPFPGILSRICDHPCETACLRSNQDEALAIRALEKACVDFGKVKPRKSFPVPPKKKKVAVIGGGMSGLGCAMELVRKGYEVALYEQSDKLGGKLWQYDSSLLPPEIILAETNNVVKAGVKIFYCTGIHSLADADGDAYFLGSANFAQRLGLSFDPESLACEKEGIFGQTRTEKYSPINELAEGIRAARSIERYFQKVSLTSGREREGTYCSKSYATIPELPTQKRVKSQSQSQSQSQDYLQNEAISEAGRCWQCECKECLKSCQFIQHFNEFPENLLKAYGKNMYAYPSIGKSSATSLINSCSLCGLCREVCPTDLNMSEASINARKIMVKREIMPMAVHDFSIRDMLFSNSEFFVAKNQPGYSNSRYIFFPGCQLGGSCPEYVSNAYTYLNTNLSGGVGLILGCCGAPAQWAGREELFEKQKEKLLSAWKELGKPQVILACPTCLKTFTQHLPEWECTLIWDWIDNPETTFLPGQVLNGNLQNSRKKLAVFDPCASRYDRKTQDTVRKIIRRIGYDIEELPNNREKAQCCSFGGLVSTVNKELADKITTARIEASANDYVTYCVNCRDDFARLGKRTWHLFDLLFTDQGLQEFSRKTPNHSEKRRNRRALKQRLLRTLWGEEMTEGQDNNHINLKISPELAEKISSDLIMIEELKQVIDYTEKSGNNMVILDNGHLIAHLRIGIITYWVEYQKNEQDDCYEIFNAYSHRMQIMEEVKNN